MKYLYQYLYLAITWAIVGLCNGLILLWHFDLNHYREYGYYFIDIETIKYWRLDCYSELKWYEKPIWEG